MCDIEAQEIYHELLTAHSILSREYDKSPTYVKATNGPSFVELYSDDEGQPSKVTIGCKIYTSHNYDDIKKICGGFGDQYYVSMYIKPEKGDLNDRLWISAARDLNTETPYIKILKDPRFMSTEVLTDLKGVMDMLGAQYEMNENGIPTMREYKIPDTDLVDKFFEIYDTYSAEKPNHQLSFKWNLYEPFIWKHPEGGDVCDRKSNIDVSVKKFDEFNAILINISSRFFSEEDSKRIDEEEVVKAIDAMLTYGCDLGDDWEFFDSFNNPPK